MLPVLGPHSGYSLCDCEMSGDTESRLSEWVKKERLWSTGKEALCVWLWSHILRRGLTHLHSSWVAGQCGEQRECVVPARAVMTQHSSQLSFGGGIISRLLWTPAFWND